MKIDLDKESLVDLVLGSSPYYSVLENSLVKKCGHWIGGFVDEWRWEANEVKKLTEKELLELHFICKNSWSKK